MQVEAVDSMRICLEVLDVGAQTAGEERADEGLRSLGDNVVVQVFPPGIGFFIAHGEGLVDRFSGVAGVPGIDSNARAESAVAI